MRDFSYERNGSPRRTRRARYARLAHAGAGQSSRPGRPAARESTSLPEPPATRSTLSYSPRSRLHPPYGPSIITSTGTGTVFTFSWFSRAMRFCSAEVYRLSARVQSPITRAPRTIEPLARQEVEAGALEMVSGCDSNTRPSKKARSWMCWPASQPPSQSSMLNYECAIEPKPLEKEALERTMVMTPTSVNVESLMR
jgi:hypothetical protein